MVGMHLRLSNLGKMSLLVNLLDAISELRSMSVILTCRNSIDHQLILFCLIFRAIVGDIERRVIGIHGCNADFIITNLIDNYLIVKFQTSCRSGS